MADELFTRTRDLFGPSPAVEAAMSQLRLDLAKAKAEAESVRRAGCAFARSVHQRMHDPDVPWLSCRFPLCGEARRLFVAPFLAPLGSGAGGDPT